MKNLAIGLIIKLLFSSNSFAQTAYYSYSAYYHLHKHFYKKFQKPVDGYIYRKKYYKGVFIKPKYSIRFVKSANSGIVVFTGFLKYYGNVIIIKHKNDYKTIYAKLKKIYVKKGQRVKKGQIIASLYRNKTIYFEIRKNIKALNTYALLK